MPSQDMPSLVLAELGKKLSVLNPVAALAFAASGLVTGPTLLLLRKLGVTPGLMEGARSQPVAERIVPWLVILAVCWFLGGLIEKHLLPPVVQYLLEEDVWKPSHFEKLNPADAVLLAPIIKAASRGGIAKAMLSPDRDSWKFEYRPWIKYPVMFFSAGIVLAVIDWLVH